MQIFARTARASHRAGAGGRRRGAQGLVAESRCFLAYGLTPVISQYLCAAFAERRRAGANLRVGVAKQLSSKAISVQYVATSSTTSNGETTFCWR